MTIDALPGPVVSALSAWLLLYAPGHALLRRDDSVLPPVLARILASTIVTTLGGTALAAFDSFSLPALLAISATVSLLGLLRRRLGPVERASSSSRDRIGALIFAAALAAYWPAYPVFLGGSDSTAYVASGVSLAHHGSLSRTDELGPTLPRPTRELLFDSMSQVFASPGPPYRRMPGAMLLESLDDATAWPCFFPVPSVWAAIFVAAGWTGAASAEQAAPNFAPLFGALALWGFWQIARRWLGTAAGLGAVALLGLSGPFYLAARMPMSEQIAAFFTLAALAVVQVAGTRMRSGDAVLAGAAFGAAVFTRVEIALLLAMAFAIAPSLRATDERGQRWPLAFVVSLLAVASLTIVQAAMLPGTWILPFFDHLQNAWLWYHLHHPYPLPLVALAVAAAAAGPVWWLVRRLGWSATLRWGFVAGIVVAHAAASNWLVERTPMWLSFYLGWPGLALAAAGAGIAVTQRERPSGAPMLLGLAAAATLVLFYNPHVYPSLPWGARRFVPLLLPLLLLLASHASLAVAARSRLLAAAGLAALAFGVALGGRPVWAEPLVDAGWEQLSEIEAAIPDGGTILIDRRISSLMLGPSLWLIHDRNSLTVPAVDGSVSRETLPGLVWYLAKGGPVYLVTKGVGTLLPTPKVNMTRIARPTTTLRYLEGTYDRRPRKIERVVTPLAIYRLEPSLQPRGTVR